MTRLLVHLRTTKCVRVIMHMLLSVGQNTHSVWSFMPLTCSPWLNVYFMAPSLWPCIYRAAIYDFFPFFSPLHTMNICKGPQSWPWWQVTCEGAKPSGSSLRSPFLLQGIFQSLEVEICSSGGSVLHFLVTVAKFWYAPQVCSGVVCSPTGLSLN